MRGAFAFRKTAFAGALIFLCILFAPAKSNAIEVNVTSWDELLAAYQNQTGDLIINISADLLADGDILSDFLGEPSISITSLIIQSLSQDLNAPSFIINANNLVAPAPYDGNTRGMGFTLYGKTITFKNLTFMNFLGNPYYNDIYDNPPASAPNYYGGALDIREGSIVSFSGNIEFSSNSVFDMGKGGAVSVMDSSISFVGESGANNQLKFFANIANNNNSDDTFVGGAAIYFRQSTAYFVNYDVFFISNTFSSRPDADTGGVFSAVNSLIYFVGEGEGNTLDFIGGMGPQNGGGLAGISISGTRLFFTNYNINFTSIIGTPLLVEDSQGETILQTSWISFVGNEGKNNTINFSHNWGGAIRLASYAPEDPVTLTFSNYAVLFENNSSQIYGGAIYISNRASTTFENSTVKFSSNIADTNGGALYMGAGDSTPELFNRLTFSNSQVEFSSNIATSSGGAIYVNYRGELIFANSTVAFYHNYGNGILNDIHLYTLGSMRVSSLTFLGANDFINGIRVSGSNNGYAPTVLKDGGGIVNFSGDASEFTNVLFQAQSGTTNFNSRVIISSQLSIADGAQVNFNASGSSIAQVVFLPQTAIGAQSLAPAGAVFSLQNGVANSTAYITANFDLTGGILALDADFIGATADWLSVAQTFAAGEGAQIFITKINTGKNLKQPLKILTAGTEFSLSNLNLSPNAGFGLYQFSDDLNSLYAFEYGDWNNFVAEFNAAGAGTPSIDLLKNI
ncbi:MAG: hypothetical protein LBC07_01205, partial [Elusimicrobiota bacterium]|nr:hypothetical protein [Elusimicrobiota bacterium]